MLIHTLNITFETSYIFLWSFGFYSQIYTTIKKKTGDGYSLNFQIIGLTSTLYLLTYNIYLLNKKKNYITIMDTIYAINTIILMSVQILLCYYYPRKINKLSWSSFVIIFVSILFIFLFYISSSFFEIGAREFIIFIGFSKLNITVVKYIFQVFLNFDRKNCFGLSIFYFLSDFFGSFFSLLQQGIGFYFFFDLDSFNYTRFFLGIVSIFFDLIIFIQYFFFYPLKYDNLRKEKKSF